ncbi:hypothetical protein [Cetobacterium ceti]
MKIRDIVTLKEFDPVIDLTRAENINEQERLLGNYIMTEKLAETFVEVLESLNLVRSQNRIELKSGDIDRVATKRAHIISGQYGMGKSYFLLMLDIILEMKNTRLYEELIRRFEKFPELNYHLKYIKENKKYFVVRINGEAENEKEFKDMLQEQILKSLRENFGDIKLKSIFEETLNSLEDFYKTGLSKNIDEYLENKELDIDDIRAGLSNYKREYLDIYNKMCKAVVSIEPKISIKKISDFLKDVDKELKNNGYDELVIILDEFSAYLTASMESNRVNKDLGQIQSLCQLTTGNSEINVSFITSTHKDLSEMLEKNNSSSKDDLDKVFGRFQQSILAFDQGEELIKNTLDLDISNFDKYKNKYKDYIERLEKKYKLNFIDFYPLHPNTVRYLEPISQLYAQKVRTTFSFLKEVVKEKYFNQEIEVNEKLKLITLSDLYDYFESAIENKECDVIRVYNQMNNSEIIKKDVELQECLKALTIAYVSSQSKSLGQSELSPEDLRDIFQFESVDYIKEKMIPVINNDYLNITTNNGKYRLFINNTGINIDKIIGKEKEGINPYRIFSNILEKSENRIFIKKDYNLKYNMGLYPFNRELTGEIYTIDDINREEENKLVKANKDGKIIFILPDFNEKFNRENLIDKYKKILFEKNIKNVAIAIPKEQIFEIDDLKEYGAILKVEKTNEDIAKNEEVRKIFIKRKRKIEDKIRNKYLRKYANFRNFIFIFGENKVKDNFRLEIDLYRELLFNYYEKYPYEIRVENFSTRGSLNKLVKLFINGGKGTIENKSKSEEIKLVSTLLKPLDLIEEKIKYAETDFEFKMPTEDISLKSCEIMNIILDKNISMDEKYTKLTMAPYGLNSNLISLYIFIANKIGKITIKLEKNTRKIISLDSNSLEELSKKPKDYIFEENKVEMISEKVGRVWKSISSLRIVVGTNCKKFRSDGKVDFNIYNALGSEFRSIYISLRDREQRLSIKDIKTGKLKSLVNKINEVNKNSDIPEEFYRAIEEIPTIFRKNTFEENMVEFDNYMEQLKKINLEEISKIEIFENILKELKYNINILKGYGDFKQRLQYLENENEKYKMNFLDIDFLHKIYGESLKLLDDYNNEYIVKHNIFHNKYDELRKKLLSEEKVKIKCLENLKEINFEDIAPLDDFFREIDDYQKCMLSLPEEKNQNIINCKKCKYNSLKEIEEVTKNIDDKFKNYHRRITGIYLRYLESLQTKEFKEHFKSNEDYRNIVIVLNNIANEEIKEEYLNAVDKKLEILKDDINEFIKTKNMRNEKSIEIKAIEYKLSEEIQALGKKYISLDELQNKFNQIVEEFKNKDYKLTKI